MGSWAHATTARVGGVVLPKRAAESCTRVMYIVLQYPRPLTPSPTRLRANLCAHLTWGQGGGTAEDGCCDM